MDDPASRVPAQLVSRSSWSSGDEIQGIVIRGQYANLVHLIVIAAAHASGVAPSVPFDAHDADRHRG